MIVFEDVRKTYETNRVKALDGVSFVIDKGEFVFVVGASGSGKSTLVRLLLKEVEPTGGRIIVGGRDLGRLKGSKVPLLRQEPRLRLRGLQAPPEPHRGREHRLRAPRSGTVERADPQEGARGAEPRRARAQDELEARGALGRRAAARLDRARRAEPSAAPRLRRADRQPRPRHVRRDHAAPLPASASTGTTILMVTHDREMVDKMRGASSPSSPASSLRDERPRGLRGRMTRSAPSSPRRCGRSARTSRRPSRRRCRCSSGCS